MKWKAITSRSRHSYRTVSLIEAFNKVKSHPVNALAKSFLESLTGLKVIL